MLIKIKKSWEISENEVTPEQVFLDRRKFISKGMVMLGAYVANPAFKVGDSDRRLTEEKLATGYNNYYEFSLDKGEVKDKVSSWNLKADKWEVEISGLGFKKKKYSISELIKLSGGAEEERIYRFRCVEAWSMVLPWGGFELGKLIKALNPPKNTKYVAFESFNDKKAAPNISSLSLYPWPYREALTIEEAMNPLSLVATGMYGKPLQKQNGAPIRLVVPWKYGFKSIKSIIKIEFTDQQPKTFWNELAPNEYGFYANVNPSVDHPRWSQSSERVIDGKFFPTRIPTKLFNGYETEVSGLYKGLDLKKNI